MAVGVPDIIVRVRTALEEPPSKPTPRPGEPKPAPGPRRGVLLLALAGLAVLALVRRR